VVVAGHRFEPLPAADRGAPFLTVFRAGSKVGVSAGACRILARDNGGAFPSHLELGIATSTTTGQRRLALRLALRLAEPGADRALALHRNAGSGVLSAAGLRHLDAELPVGERLRLTRAARGLLVTVSPLEDPR